MSNLVIDTMLDSGFCVGTFVYIVIKTSVCYLHTELVPERLTFNHVLKYYSKFFIYIYIWLTLRFIFSIIVSVKCLSHQNFHKNVYLCLIYIMSHTHAHINGKIQMNNQFTCKIGNEMQLVMKTVVVEF